jgi:hypothetical protein
MSHSQFWGREDVDSRLLVVGSQTASLTPDPSFAHNLGCRCPNGQCEAIFDIYSSIPFQWHQEHLNARCFGPCCWALNIRESWRTPNPQLWECWASPPHLAKVGLRHYTSPSQLFAYSQNIIEIWHYVFHKKNHDNFLESLCGDSLRIIIFNFLMLLGLRWNIFFVEYFYNPTFMHGWRWAAQRWEINPRWCVW